MFIVLLLAFASLGGVCLDVLHPPFAHYMSEHQVVDRVAQEVIFLLAAYVIFDTVVARRDQARWRRVAQAAVTELLVDARAIIDAVEGELMPIWATRPYAYDAEDSEILRDILRSHQEETEYPKLVRRVRTTSDQLRRTFRTWAPALAGNALLDPILSRIPDVVTYGLQLAMGLEDNVDFGGREHYNDYVEHCVIAYDQYLSYYALLYEAVESAKFDLHGVLRP